MPRGRRKTGDARRSRSRTNTIGIVGLGLIGGSLAKAIAARFPKRALIGVEPNSRARRLARRDGIFDRLLPRPSVHLAHCDVVVLCAPVPAILRLLGPVSRRMRRGAVLTDVGGIKRPIVIEARRSVRSGVPFVGAHPMIGGESGGYAASRPEAWKGGTVALCADGASKRAVETIVRLHRALGARVVLCRAADHDAAIAAVSHLPYVVASALALTARDVGPLARELAGRGFADATRLASFAWGVQGEATRSNAAFMKAARSFQRNLRRLLQALAAADRKEQRLFDRARAARAALAPHG